MGTFEHWRQKTVLFFCGSEHVRTCSVLRTCSEGLSTRRTVEEGRPKVSHCSTTEYIHFGWIYAIWTWVTCLFVGTWHNRQYMLCFPFKTVFFFQLDVHFSNLTVSCKIVSTNTCAQNNNKLFKVTGKFLNCKWYGMIQVLVKKIDHFILSCWLYLNGAGQIM